MAIASSHHSFLTNALTSSNKPKSKKINRIPINNKIISSSSTKKSNELLPLEEQDSPTRKNENKFAKLAMVALAAGVLTLGSVDPASAAKSGGRVGGQAFKSSAPRSSSPRINKSRTNIYINPPVAPPLVGGYGYGYGYGGGWGWGWSPFSFFAPGPAVAVGVGGGFDTLVFFLILGAGAAVVRRFFGSRQEDDDE